jgi:hypothetical protein
MPEDGQQGVPPMFRRNSDGVTPEFAADMLARIQAAMAGLGLQQEMLTPLETEAVAMHVVFQALVKGGFTADEAIKYLAWRTS